MMESGSELTREMALITGRTRKCTGVSVILHVLLLLWLIFSYQLSPEEEGLTEITFLDAIEPVPAALPVAVAKSEQAWKQVIQKPSRDPQEDHVKRELPRADIAPQPQRIEQVQNTISERLASLQKAATDKPSDIAALATPSPVGRPKLAGTSDHMRPPRQAELSRQERTSPQPIELSRNKRKITKAEIVTSPLPDAPVQRARPKKSESDARRVLAGAQLTGPVADRPVLSYEVPNYPEWAKKEAVEGSVTIYFVVLPDGRVKENVMVEKTAGFADFDENAVHALLTWRFEPLKGGATGEQWGTITFHYRLSDVN